MPSAHVNNDTQFNSAPEYLLNASNGVLSLNSTGGPGSIDINAEKYLTQSAGSTIINMIDGNGNGALTLQAKGNGAIVLQLYGNQNASALCITDGGISIINGDALTGAKINLNPNGIELMVGQAGKGPTISLAPDSITLQVGPSTKLVLNAQGITQTVGTNTSEIDANGITETVGDVERSIDDIGHTFKAAETRCDVTNMGFDVSAPEINLDSEATVQFKGATLQEMIEATLNVQAALNAQQ